MDLAALIKKVDPENQVKLKVLHNATIQTTRAYKDDPTKIKLLDWKAAQDAFGDTVEELTALFDDDRLIAGAGGAPNWKQYKDTKNKAGVLRFLLGDGWEVKKQTFYNHCKSGKLTKNNNGLYSSRIVKKYAETWLVRTDTGQTVGEESEDLLATKTREEILRIKTSRQRDEFKLGIERGKYIPRADLDAELAARAIVFDNGFIHMIQASAPDIIALVGGDHKRSADLVVFLTDKKDELLNEYATMGRFSVHFDGASEND